VLHAFVDARSPQTGMSSAIGPAPPPTESAGRRSLAVDGFEGDVGGEGMGAPRRRMRTPFSAMSMDEEFLLVHHQWECAKLNLPRRTNHCRYSASDFERRRSAQKAEKRASRSAP